MDFLRLDGEKINISNCVNCTSYGYVYTNIDTMGNATWIKYNIEPEYIDTHGEGIYYGFVCNECKIVATGYQQT